MNKAAPLHSCLLSGGSTELSLVKPCWVSALSVLPTQVRLAQIVEIIHAVYLLQDDGIDEPPPER